MVTKARICRKFQVTISEEVRKFYALEESQTVSVETTPQRWRSHRRPWFPRAPQDRACLWYASCGQET